ncbi:MAG: Uma2 family endonuclease, partial [Egibacteraceae bacterium]
MAVATGARMAHAVLEKLEAEGKLDESLRYEILNGELVIRGAPRTRHERAVSTLMRYFTVWAHEHGGDVFAGLGIEIGDQRPIPDCTVIGPDRVDELAEDGFHVPPDLVVEVTSPGTRSLDLHEKRDIYQQLGVPEYWVVDLHRDVVLVHRRDPKVAGPTDRCAYAVTEHIAGATRTPAGAPGRAGPAAELLPRRRP